PAPAPGHRPGSGAPTRHLPVRRLVLGPGPGHGRPVARRTRPGGDRLGDGPGRPTGVDHPPRGSDPGPRGRSHRRSRNPRGTPRIVPDLRRDRGVAADRRGGGVSTSNDKPPTNGASGTEGTEGANSAPAGSGSAG